jgi:hypothetical protein
MLFRHFADAESECKALLVKGAEGNRQTLAVPAYEQVVKASHTFNLLDARGVISVTERQSYILRIRDLAKACGEAWLQTEGGIAAYALLSGTDPAAPPPPLAVLVSIIAFIGGLAIAVAWHRFILLDEQPSGWLPAFDGRRMLSYFGYSLLLALIALVIMIVVGLVLGIFAILGGVIMFVLTSFVTVFIILVIGFRLALILPASSVDKRLRLGEAWAATSGATGDIVVLALLCAGASVVLGLVSLIFVGPLLPLGILWDAAVGWLSLMVGMSILTTLYGHYVENRPISD